MPEMREVVVDENKILKTTKMIPIVFMQSTEQNTCQHGTREFHNPRNLGRLPYGDGE